MLLQPPQSLGTRSLWCHWRVWLWWVWAPICSAALSNHQRGLSSAGDGCLCTIRATQTGPGTKPDRWKHILVTERASRRVQQTSGANLYAIQQRFAKAMQEKIFHFRGAAQSQFCRHRGGSTFPAKNFSYADLAVYFPEAARCYMN